MRLAIPMTFFFLFFGIGSIQPFVVPYLRNDLHLSALKASSIIGVLYLVFGIARFFTRYLIRLIEKRNTIILGVIGYLCLPVSLTLGGNYPLYMLGAILMGVGGALVWTASSVQVLDTAEAQGKALDSNATLRSTRRYGAASGVMYFFVQAGISLGTIQAGVIAAWTGHKSSATNYLGVFQASSVVGFLAVFSALLVPRVRSRFVDDRWSGGLSLLQEARESLSPGGPGDLLQHVRHHAHDV